MNQLNGQQPKEFDLITEIHIMQLPDMPGWKVTVIESDGFSYPVEIYDNVNLAFERARIIHLLCKQPVTIKIVGESGETVAVECEKLNQLEFLGMTRAIYIYFNEKIGCWELCSSISHVSSITSGIASEDDAVEWANFIKALNPECKVTREKELPSPSIADNTCRARGCKWNINDSCLQLPRNSSLPLPAVDTSFETWTEHNNPIPRSCLNYSPKEPIER